jgi:hypothetical protein
MLGETTMLDEAISSSRQTASDSKPDQPSVLAGNGSAARSRRDTAIREARLQVLSSIRSNVRDLSPERYDEIFNDFAGAVEKRDIGYLADTILNWALGGHGYEYTGEPVNHLEPIITSATSEEDRAIWEEMWSGEREQVS